MEGDNQIGGMKSRMEEEHVDWRVSVEDKDWRGKW